MSGRTCRCLLSVSLLLVAGCSLGTPMPRCTAGGDRPGPSTGYWTVHQAYDRVQPAILSWHDDAVVTNVHAAFRTYRPDWGMRSDGTAPGWTFSVTSPGAQVATDVTLWDGQVYVGLDFGCGHPEIDLGPQPLAGPEGMYLRMDQAIGSDQAAAIVIAEGVSLEGLRRFDLVAYSASWDLVFDGPLERSKQVILDATNGAVRRNDFAD